MKLRVEFADGTGRRESLEVEPETTVGEIMARVGCLARDGWAGRGARGELFGCVSSDPIRFYAGDGGMVLMTRGTWVWLPGGLPGWTIGTPAPGSTPMFDPGDTHEGGKAP